MYMFSVRNVEEALPVLLQHLDFAGVKEQSRNGEVLVLPTPICVEYRRPWERVLSNPVRDCNHFFHFFESLWMLAGRNDLEFVKHFSGQMKEYSDDGSTLNGAYGYRWRKWFGVDQIEEVVQRLSRDKKDRRAVLQMWDGKELTSSSLDLCCNTAIYVRINPQGKLTITVTNRSNDLIWGMTGANAVHMSFLQEYLAHAVGVPMGSYYQFSNNLHAYTWNDKLTKLRRDYSPNLYVECEERNLRPVQPLMTREVGAKAWREDLSLFLELVDAFIEHPCSSALPKGYPLFKHEFFGTVAWPIWKAWVSYKVGTGVERYVESIMELNSCQALDWRMACQEWLSRRHDKAKEKSQNVEV